MEELERARAEIDRVDAALAALFEARMAAVRTVSREKAARGLPVRDPERERTVLERSIARLRDPSLGPLYAGVVRSLMAAGRGCQYALRQAADPDAAAAEAAGTDEAFMGLALACASAAAAHGNEPFGAVLVRAGRVLRTAENRIFTGSDPTLHAEAGLIREYCAETGVTDLSDCTLYSSCEPCFQCSGAMVWARLGRLVYAASNEDLAAVRGKTGCRCSELVFTHSGWRPEVTSGVLRAEGIRVLRTYFGNQSE